MKNHETAIPIRDESRPTISPDSPMHNGILGLRESAFLQQIQGIKGTENVTVFPRTWNDEKRCVRDIEEQAPFSAGLGKAPGLEEIGKDLNLTVEMSNIGKIEMPGAGYARILTTISVADKPERIILIYPGYKHTDQYFRYTWFMHYLAQIAKTLKAKIVIVNPEGRGVVGFNEAKGVSRISRKDIHEDTAFISNEIISKYLADTESDVADVIVFGHSMGAKLARVTAEKLLRRKQDRHEGTIKLRGIIQDAPIGASMFADLRTATYVKAILPHLGSAIANSYGNQRGCEIKARDVLSIFTNDTTIENLRASIAGMTRSSWRYFFEETLFPGDINDYRETLRTEQTNLHPHNGGVGAKIIYHGQDRVFSPGASADMTRFPNKRYENPGSDWMVKLDDMPHCHPAIPTRTQLEGMRAALSFAFGITLETPANVQEL